MSKNPAWNAYNEKGREINEEYEKTVRPLRIKLGSELATIEKRFDDKIRPLVLERETLLGGLKDKYAEQVKEAEEKRQKAIKVAHNVLTAELAAGKTTLGAGAAA